METKHLCISGKVSALRCGVFFMEKNHVHLNFLFKMLHILHLIKTKAINMTY